MRKHASLIASKMASPRKLAIPHKAAAYRQLATPTHLGEKAREEISKALNPLVADAFALYVKTKNFHWHLFGPHFRDYHLLFDEHADQILPMVDVIAERIRKLGGLTIHSIREIHRLQRIEDDDEPLVEAREMIRRLHKDNLDYAARMLDAHEVCEKNNDFASTSILEIFIDETERRGWFLFEAMQESPRF